MAHIYPFTHIYVDNLSGQPIAIIRVNPLAAIALPICHAPTMLRRGSGFLASDPGPWGRFGARLGMRLASTGAFSWSPKPARPHSILRPPTSCTCSVTWLGAKAPTPCTTAHVSEPRPGTHGGPVYSFQRGVGMCWLLSGAAMHPEGVMPGLLGALVVGNLATNTPLPTETEAPAPRFPPPI